MNQIINPREVFVEQPLASPGSAKYCVTKSEEEKKSQFLYNVSFHTSLKKDKLGLLIFRQFIEN